MTKEITLIKGSIILLLTLIHCSRLFLSVNRSFAKWHALITLILKLQHTVAWKYTTLCHIFLILP